MGASKITLSLGRGKKEKRKTPTQALIVKDMARAARASLRLALGALLAVAFGLWLLGVGGPGLSPLAGAAAVSWTIFITPQDFVDAAAATQRRAIRSWLLLEVRGWA